MTPAAYLASHGTTRWHTNPDVPAQSLADHSAGVLAFVLWLVPEPSTALIYEAIHHDDGEGLVGDMSGPMKRKMPRFAEQLEAAEMAARHELGVVGRVLTARERVILKIADDLEALTFAHCFGRPGLTWRDDWHAMADNIHRMAVSIDDQIAAKVSDWIKELYDGS